MFPLLYFSCNYLSRTNAFSGRHIFGFAKQSKTTIRLCKWQKKKQQSRFSYTPSISKEKLWRYWSPQSKSFSVVAIWNKTSFFISLFADCQNYAQQVRHTVLRSVWRALFFPSVKFRPLCKNGSLNRRWDSLFVLQIFMCVAFSCPCLLVPHLGTVLQFILFSSYITDIGRSHLNAIC